MRKVRKVAKIFTIHAKRNTTAKMTRNQRMKPHRMKWKKSRRKPKKENALSTFRFLFVVLLQFWCACSIVKHVTYILVCLFRENDTTNLKCMKMLPNEMERTFSTLQQQTDLTNHIKYFFLFCMYYMYNSNGSRLK